MEGPLIGSTVPGECHLQRQVSIDRQVVQKRGRRTPGERGVREGADGGGAVDEVDGPTPE
jgi:hypothetical protein